VGLGLVPRRKADSAQASGNASVRRRPAHPAPAAAPAGLRAYGCPCAGTCPRCSSRSESSGAPAPIQRALRVGSSQDGAEREADQAAERVVGRLASAQVGAPSMSPHAPHDASSPERGAPELEGQIAEARAEGRPLEAPLRGEMEGAFGRGFSDVRVHRGPRSAAASDGLDARAFTHGKDIFFNRGEFDPGTTRGKRLIAHELTHTVQQGSTVRPGGEAAPMRVQRAEKIKKEEVRLFQPKTQISATEVATLAEKPPKVAGDFDMVSSSGSKDAAFTKAVEGIALFVASAFTEPNFRSVLALDFSKVDWKKVGVKDAATKTKFGAGLHAFELIRWDGGKKLQLRMNYLKEVTEISAADSTAKIKAGTKKFADGGFAFKAPTAAEKKLGYKDWASSEQDIVYMAVSRVPDAMLKHANVKGIEFYRIKKAGKFSAQYDQSKHRMEVGDDTFEITEAGVTTTLASPADLYKQSSALSGDAASGFISLTEYTIIHEISHAMDWGPVRAELKDLIAASEGFNAAATKADKQKAKKDIDKALKAFSTKTTLSGARFEETKPNVVEEVNPAAQTDFEKAIAGKTESTPYAGTATGEAFAEGLALYVVNPALLKEYRPDLYAYFKKLLP
jgi:Domain of unknown function (DUF4157)